MLNFSQGGLVFSEMFRWLALRPNEKLTLKMKLAKYLTILLQPTLTNNQINWK